MSRTGRSRWWRLAPVPVPGLVLFAGPGLVLVPGAVLAAVARSLRAPAAKVLALVAAVVSILVPAVGLDPAPAGDTSPSGWLGLLLVVAATAAPGVGFHEWWRRWGASKGAESVIFVRS